MTTFALILGSSLAQGDDSVVEPLLTDFDEWVGPKLGKNVTEKEFAEFTNKLVVKPD